MVYGMIFAFLVLVTVFILLSYTTNLRIDNLESAITAEEYSRKSSINVLQSQFRDLDVAVFNLQKAVSELEVRTTNLEMSGR